MSQSLFVLCPGQGAQSVGMARDYHDTFPTAKKTFADASAILGWDLADVCFNGPEERLSQTDVSQPAIFTASVACYRVAVEKGLIPPAAVTAVAGLSLGEYTALHLAGVFSFEAGVRLVAARGKFMQEAAVANPSGMVALIGADEATAVRLCAEAAQGQVLVPANFNAPGQIVASGANEACARLASAAEAAGLKASILKVAGAFHSPLMQTGADRMAKVLAEVEFAPAKTPVYSNVTAALHGDAASIKALLVRQITEAVRWEQTMQLLVKSAGARFVELAPGRVLSGLMKRIDRRLPVENLGTVPA